MRPFILTPQLNTRSTSLKTEIPKSEIQDEMRVANINEPSEQEIDRQSNSDSNLYQSADNGSDGEGW